MSAAKPGNDLPVAGLRCLQRRDAILDGEVVALDDEGRMDFRALYQPPPSVAASPPGRYPLPRPPMLLAGFALLLALAAQPSTPSPAIEDTLLYLDLRREVSPVYFADHEATPYEEQWPSLEAWLAERRREQAECEAEER